MILYYMVSGNFTVNVWFTFRGPGHSLDRGKFTRGLFFLNGGKNVPLIKHLNKPVPFLLCRIYLCCGNLLRPPVLRLQGFCRAPSQSLRPCPLRPWLPGFLQLLQQVAPVTIFPGAVAKHGMGHFVPIVLVFNSWSKRASCHVSNGFPRN